MRESVRINSKDIYRDGFVVRPENIAEEKFFERLGFQTYGDGISAMNYYRMLLNNSIKSGEPNCTVVGFLSNDNSQIVVEYPEHLTGFLRKFYGLGEREAKAAMSYFKQVIKGYEYPKKNSKEIQKKVMSNIMSFLDKEFIPAQEIPLSSQPHLD